MWQEVSHVCSLLTSHKETLQMFHTEALILSHYIQGGVEPINDVKSRVESLYPDVYELIEEV